MVKIYNRQTGTLETMPLKVKRYALPPTAFYRLECCDCDQIFGTKWIRAHVAMWHPYPPLKLEHLCPLCGSQNTKCKPINKEEYDKLEQIWDLEDLQFQMPDDGEDEDIPMIDLSNLD
jgi:hypothetical protein